MKKMLLMAVVASSLFACNQQEITDTGVLDAESSTVSLTIAQVPTGRGVSDQKENTEFAVIGSARLFFIDATGTSIYQRELSAAEIATLANTSTTPGNKTVEISGVPNTAVSLFFIANVRTPGGASFPMIDGTIADARLRIDKLQADAVYVPMSGLSNPFVQVGTTNKYTTAVSITPLVARLELGQLTCQNQNGAGQPAVTSDITGYKLSGVFINNLRSYVLLSGLPYVTEAPVDIKSQVGWAAGWADYFTAANTSFPYYTGGSPAAPADWVPNSMLTYCTPAGGVSLSFYPDPTNGSTSTLPTVTPKKVWGYQVCPSSTVPVGTAYDVPHLMLKLTEVAYVNNPLGLSTQYITVTKYKDASNNPITEFKRGNVYRIQNLIFTHNEATNQPYEKDIIVTATVSVIPWVVNSINPDWN